MTARLVFGIDPGVFGAIAVLADGRCSAIEDMPKQARAMGKGDTVDGAGLAAFLREQRAKFPGAYVIAALEKVGGVQGQAASLSFNFGENVGIVRGVLAGLEIDCLDVRPQTWKREYALLGTDKDEARIEAIAKFPGWAKQLARKKDGGRADAMLIGLWAELNECAKPRKVIREGLFRGFIET